MNHFEKDKSYVDDTADVYATTTTTTTTTTTATTLEVDTYNMDELLPSPPPSSSSSHTHRRRLVGRAARRRRRKLKEICAIETIFLDQQRQSQQQRIQEHLPKNDVREATTPTTHQIMNSTHVLPTDRDRIWPAVIELRIKNAENCSTAIVSRWTDSDNVSLIGQLGYVPGNAIQVVCRLKDLAATTNDSSPSMLTSSNHAFRPKSFLLDSNNNNDSNSPVVLQLYPIVYRYPHAGGKSGGKPFKLRKRQRVVNKDTSLQQQKGDVGGMDDPMLIEPFPTIYWLTHPYLRSIVSKLELEGFGIQLERRLQIDSTAQHMMRLAHDAYGQERYNFLSESDLKLIQSNRWEKAFATTRGVAGITNTSVAVKCLHAHLAHYLSNSLGSQHNVVGRWVWEEIHSRFTLSGTCPATYVTVLDTSTTSRE